MRADCDKPLWGAVRAPTVSRISDDEMARINVEVSAAMAQWIDLSLTTKGSHRLAIVSVLLTLVGLVLAALALL